MLAACRAGNSVAGKISSKVTAMIAATSTGSVFAGNSVRIRTEGSQGLAPVR